MRLSGSVLELSSPPAVPEHGVSWTLDGASPALESPMWF